MGRNVYKMIVPFKIESVFRGVSHEMPEGPLQEYQECMEDDITQGRKTVRGWSFNNHDPSIYRQENSKGDLVVWKLEKGSLVVYEINEDQYANGGGVDQSFFSDSKEALVQFCKDWMFDDSKIIEGAVTIQVL